MSIALAALAFAGSANAAICIPRGAGQPDYCPTLNADDIEDYASETPLGLDGPQSAYDSGILDPVDRTTDPDNSDSGAVPIQAALISEGIDMSKVTILDDYAAVISASAAGYDNCPSKYTCLWRHAYYRGRSLFAAAGSFGYVWHNLRDFGLSDEISSWRNRRGYVTRLARDTDGHGAQVCLARYSHNGRMYYMNDKASSFRLTPDKYCGN